MKNSIALLSVFVFTILCSNSFAQTKTEYHSRISSHHSAITQSTDKLSSGVLTTKEAKLKEADAIGTHLNGAQADHLTMHGNLSQKHKDTVKENHEALKKYHSQALESHRLLREEILKSNSDEVKIKYHAASIKQNVVNAEGEHKKIGRKTGNPMM